MDRRRWSLLLRVLLSLALIAALVYHIGSAAILARLGSVHGRTVALAVLALAISFLFVTPRWAIILYAFGYHVRSKQLVGSVLLGFLFNQLLPTAIGGEVVRVWRARQLGVPLDVAVYSVLFDRASGVFVAFVGAMLLLPIGRPHHGQDRLFWILALIAIAGAIGCVILLAISRMEPSRLPVPAYLHQSVLKATDGLNTLIRTPWATICVLVLAFVNQGLPIIAIWLFGRDLSLGLGFTDIALVTMISTLAATLPLSFAGWGIREGALVYLFGLYDVSADVALAISMLYGVAQAIAGAPGALMLLARFKQPSSE
jgi:uncharacterized protein (TIRG00374 family)